ncbi:MAG: glycosyltransferase family 39 protein [Porticoccaceae bacterium]
MRPIRSWTDAVCLLLAMALVCALVVFGEIRYTGSDPRGALLLSDSLAFHQSFKLDHYERETLDRYGYTIHQKNGHDYYFFPIGTSLVSIPVVIAGKLLGFSHEEHELPLQIATATIAAALILLFLYRFAGLFLEPRNALLLALTFWLGTSLSSTGGTALWSHNFATLFALMAIFYAVRPVLRQDTVPWLLIATLLFLAYLCRPTLALLAPCLLLFLLFHTRKAAILSGIALASWLGIFVLWSYGEFGQPLPDYYLPARLVGGNLPTALAGNLISPGRGLLIYSSFIAAVWLYRWSARGRSIFSKPWWLLPALLWPLLHLVFVSRFPHWWGGWSYGARLTMDVLPGLYLLTLAAWPRDLAEVRRTSKVAVALLAASCVISVFANACQGLYNPYSARWNANPNIDVFPAYLFDWRYPPFLHNQARHAARNARHERATGVTDAVVVLRHDDSNILFTNWYNPEPYQRWSSGNFASLTFTLPDEQQLQGVITIAARYLDEQRVRVKLNSHPLGSYVSSDVKIARTFHIDPTLLLPGQTNTLSFELPDAHRPDPVDSRELAIAIHSIAIR